MTYDELMALFDEDTQQKVEAALESVQGIAVYKRDDGKVSIRALVPDLPDVLDDGFVLTGTYTKPLLEVELSRTQQALHWMKETGGSPYAAAKHFGIDASAVYRGMKRAAKTRCPCCGQTLKG